MSIKAVLRQQDGKEVLSGIIWYTRKEVALLMGVREDTVKRWCRQGKLPYSVRRMMQPDGKMRRMAAVPQPALDAFFAKYWRPQSRGGRAITMLDLLDRDLKSKMCV